jgi:hypothetical protein
VDLCADYAIARKNTSPLKVAVGDGADHMS